MNQHKFFICKHCGNIIGMIENKGVPVVCCGEKMTELVPNTADAAGEKHVPVIKIDDNLVTVTIGAVEHPMLEAHYIQWIYLATKNGGQRKVLAPGQKPEVTFALHDDEAVAAYAYCNLHGLWKADV